MKKTIILLAVIAGLNANAQQSWNLTGNAGTNPASNFLGTTDNQPLVFKINNEEKVRITEKRIVFQGITTSGPAWDKNFFLGGGGEDFTGFHNTAVGLGSLTLNLKGAGNTAIGINSMSILKDGISNSSLGINSMLNATVGNLNTALGAKTMEGPGSYEENVAVGFASLGRSNGAEPDKVAYNTALGSRSLAYLKNGQNNIAIGYNSIKPLTSGSNNIAVGSHSGFLLVNGNGNIVIGNNADVRSASSNDELNIGNWIVGNNGTIGIGEFAHQLPADGIAPDGEKYKLFVKDGIKTEKVKVDIAVDNGWADYVFEKNYKLIPLNELDQFISKNGHLPEVPTTEQAIKNGIELKEMNILLLKKVEEITLHLINQNKQIEDQNKQFKVQKEEIEALKKQINSLK